MAIGPPRCRTLITLRPRIQPRRRAATVRGRSAFTLTELVIVVMVMGILAAVAVPKFFDSLLFYRVESAARRVVADLELLRRTARLTSDEQTMTFNGSTYILSAGVAGLDRASDVYTVDLAASPFHLTSVLAELGGEDEDTLTFNGYGTPTTGGDIVLGAPGYECTISVDVATGAIEILRDYKGGRMPE